MERSSLLVISLLLLCHVAFGQTYQLTGRVADQATQVPLVGAHLIARPLGVVAVTRADGSFRFENLPAGEYRVMVRFVGYQPVEQTILLQENREVFFALEEMAMTSQEVMVYAARNYPVTRSEVSRELIERVNLGQDLPVLLNFQPSVVTTSDAGGGIGYTGLRIRGSDAQRINVTLNGIPVNDAESHGVFWVNMPDLSSSLNRVVIQRGVGTSVNGAGAFGASVNLEAQQPEQEASVTTSHSVGSFQTVKNNVEIHTGELANGLSFYGRASRIVSDGFIDNAFSNLRSLYFSGAYQKEKHQVRFNILSGREQTFQAWYGVPEAILRAGNRTFNPVAGYDNETDNYGQDHYQLFYTFLPGQRTKLHTALHYTRGLGYYEQFMGEDNPFAERDFAFYGWQPLEIGGETITETDLIRRRWLDNHFFGGIWSLHHTDQQARWDLVWGGGMNRYLGSRYGEIIWARFAHDSFIRDRYYDNNSYKNDWNTYLKVNFQPVNNLFLFADMQIRAVDFASGGFESLALNNKRIEDRFVFFNPKVGVNYMAGNTQWYMNLGVGNKEPVLLDYYSPDVLNGNRNVSHETLYNLESGMNRSVGQMGFSVNYYYMRYTNQLVPTGQLNDVGFNVRANVANSYRTGVELEWRWAPSTKWLWAANATFSQNKVLGYEEFLTDFSDFSEVALRYEKTDIAFSPNLIVGSDLTWKPASAWEIGLLSKYVGRQFMDNTSSPESQLDAYFTTDLRIGYTVKKTRLREIGLRLLVNNVFNEQFESNGYVFSYLFEGARSRDNAFYPQAGTNFLMGIVFKL